MQEVFDKDLLSADDTMGEAEIDLQPLVSAARIHEGMKNRGRLQIGKWLATNDNALVADSIIWLKDDGKVMQDLCLQLQNVESGILQLELEWSPLNEYEEQESFNLNMRTISSASKRSDQFFKSTSSRKSNSFSSKEVRNSGLSESKMRITKSLDSKKNKFFWEETVIQY